MWSHSGAEEAQNAEEFVLDQSLRPIGLQGQSQYLKIAKFDISIRHKSFAWEEDEYCEYLIGFSHFRRNLFSPNTKILLYTTSETSRHCH